VNEIGDSTPSMEPDFPDSMFQQTLELWIRPEIECA